jgi:hypothetical protein
LESTSKGISKLRAKAQCDDERFSVDTVQEVSVALVFAKACMKRLEVFEGEEGGVSNIIFARS